MSARPFYHRALWAHLLATLLVSAGMSFWICMIPLIARLRFGASEWQLFFVTAASPALMTLSLAWNELLRRNALPRYLALHWLTTMLPVAGLGLVGSFPQLLLLHVLACIGVGGWSPVNGELLNRLYPAELRGRIYGLLMIPATASGAVTVVLGGWLLERHEAAMAWLFPALAAGYALAMLILARLGRGRLAVPLEPRGQLGLKAVLAPLSRMRATLRDDAFFRRYEFAFMTYGAGFMICDMLLPLLVTGRLGLSYGEVAFSAHGTRQVLTLLCVLPLGLVMDRLGAERISALAFGCLAFYPLGLLVAGGPVGLALASVFFGIGLAGVHHGWMLGPVSLAPHPGRVSEYVAIHAALVGVRGIVFQGLGVALYLFSGSFTVPLLAAAAAFGWAASQMMGLHAARRRAAATACTAGKADDSMTLRSRACVPASTHCEQHTVTS